MVVKKCTKCRIDKNVESFPKNKNKGCKLGLSSRCKECSKPTPEQLKRINERRRAHYYKNREKLLSIKSQRDKERREKNPDWRKSEIERKKKYRENNKEKTKEYYEINKERSKKYYKENKERMLALSKQWSNDNSHMSAIYKNKKNTPPWSDMEKLKEIYNACKIINEIDTNDDWEVDHIIPLKGINVSGLHVHNNVRIVKKRENRLKGKKFSEYFFDIYGNDYDAVNDSLDLVEKLKSNNDNH